MKTILALFDGAQRAAVQAMHALGGLLARIEQSCYFRAAVFALLLAVIGVMMMMLNSHTPLMMDDYDYSFSLSTGERIKSVLDVIPSQIAHYNIWGGRSVVHAIAQLFLSMDKAVFNVANALMYLLLLLEIYAIAGTQHRSFSYTLLLAAHAALFFCVPFFGTVFLWLDGACNYLWGTALALCPILLHKSALKIGFFASGRLRSVFAVLVCFLAGWTNENTACGVFAVVFLLVVFAWIKGRRVALWQWLALCAQLLGIAVMLLAPGNFVRASAVEQRSMLVELAYRLAVVTVYALVYCGGLFAALVFLLSICAKMRFERVGEAGILLFGAAITAYALIGSPVVSDRSYIGAFVLALCALLVLVGEMEEHIRLFDAQKLIVLPVLLLLIAYGGYKAYGAVAAHETAWNAQLARIEEAVSSGQEEAVLESVPSVSPYTFSVKLEEDPGVWPNSTLSKYFGVQIRGGQ